MLAAATSIASVGIGTVVPGGTASAATTCSSVTSFTWTGGGDVGPSPNPHWSDAANWQGLPATAPQPSTCVSLTFPSSALAMGTTTNDISNLEITSLTINGAYTLVGTPAVFMGDSGAGATVTDTATATIGLTENVRNNTVFNVASGSTLTVSGPILDVSPTPATALTSSGSGVLNLSSASNTYTGKTVVGGGTLQLSNPSALGASGNSVTVQSGATLQLGPFAGTFALPQAVTLAGGTVLGTDANDQLNGAVTLTAGSDLSSVSTKSLTVTQPVGGTGPLTINSGTTGTVTLGGTADNTYTGGTTVDGGTLNLAVATAAPSAIAAPGALSVASGGAVTLADPGQLDPAGTLTLTGASSVDLGGQATTVGNLVLNSTSTTAAPTVKDTTGAGSVTVASGITSQGTGLPSVISANLDAPSPGPLAVQTPNSLVVSGQVGGGPVSLVAPASGSPNYCASGTSTAQCVALVLSANSSGWAGPVSVGAGVLDVTGNLSGAPVTVGGGTLTGTGTVGSLTVNSGNVAPGTTVAVATGKNLTDADAPGVLTASTLAMNGGTLAVRLDGANPGGGTTTCSGYDQVHVTGGSLTLSSTSSNLSAVVDKNASNAPCFIPPSNQQYSIISNPAGGATESGNFSGLPEGGTVTDQNFSYQYSITYAGGTPPASVVLSSDVTTNMSVTTSGSPTTYGQQVTFTATVSQKTGNIAPSGSVKFTDSDNGQTVTIVCSQSASSNNVVLVSADVAKCTPTQALPGGANQTVTATYSGDTHFPGNSATVSQTVNPQPTTTSLSGGTPNPSTYGQQVTFKATVAGVPAGGTQTPTVPPTGTVTFFADGNALADCTGIALTGSPTAATCKTTMLSAGSHKVTATYNGDGNYASSSNGQGISQTVNQSGTTTTIAPSDANPDPSSYGQPVTFTAMIAPASQGPAAPSGTVTFESDGTALADCTAVPVTPTSNTVSCTSSDLPLSPQGGSDTITAVYSGDSNYGGSTSSGTSQTVDQTSTTTGVAASPNPAHVGEKVTYTATVTPQYSGLEPPGGTVAFSVGGTTIPGCGAQAVTTTQGQTTASCSVIYNQVGSYSIGAAYSGDPRYTASATSDNTSPTGPVSQQVNPASTVTQLSSSPNPSLAQQQVTFVATLVPSTSGNIPPTGTVSFQLNGTSLSGCGSVPVATANGATTATCKTSSLPYNNDSQTTDPIDAVYSGDANFVGSTSNVVFQTVRLNASQLGAEPHVLAFQANGGALWTVGSVGVTNWGVGMAPNTSPAVLSLPNGGYEIAFQANGGNLWTVGTAGWTNWGVGMAPGTSPAAFSMPNGGYEIAFQANGGNLWTVGTVSWTNWGVGMAPGTNPGVTSLPNGGYEIGFQANGGALWTVGTAGWTNWGVGMASHTSPSLIALPNGGYQIAFQANGGNLWTIGAAGWTNWGLGMMPNTSPGLALNPSGGVIEGIQDFQGYLRTVGTQDFQWQLGMAPSTSPSMI